MAGQNKLISAAKYNLSDNYSSTHLVVSYRDLAPNVFLQDSHNDNHTQKYTHTHTIIHTHKNSQTQTHTHKDTHTHKNTHTQKHTHT